MNVVHVEPQTFRQFGDLSEAGAVALAAAGVADQVAVIAAAVPVFGLIGQEFLTSFAFAQANHFTAVIDLAQTLAATGHTAHAAADAYETSERHSAESFTPLGRAK
ncbi:type VII secretion target [Nocardia salmonicida]|uniref:type VII secretion target n=1 Tax=Nocardia salmonicida TaxID=53431 RepID=UPI0007C7C421|nr:type VII secretion target [Nocardia salmonicida]